MANIRYSDLLDEVLPNLQPGVPDPVAENAIKRSVIEFCAGAWIWKELSDPIDIVVGESTYDLEPSTGADVAVVVSAEAGGMPLEHKAITWLNKEHPGWRTRRATPIYFTQFDTEQIVLAPTPDATNRGGLLITLALQPSHHSTSFPKWIFNQFLYALADGAIAKLMLMPNKPWTDIANGTDRRNRFEAAIANARSSATAALGSAVQRTSSQH